VGHEEVELLERSRRGDHEAYGRLIRSYQDLVYGLVSRMVRDPELAEELTQDAFLKAFRNLSAFRGEAKFSTWLYRITVNLCRDHLGSLASRRRNRELSLDSPELGGLEPAAGLAGPDQEMEAGETAADFQAGLDGLAPMYREAFLLRHQEGLDYQEIAGVLEITVSNAKVRVHRAREMLMEVLRSRGHDV
jgi:RNA polymerase sigma-70 factor (ECF subfamily)